MSNIEASLGDQCIYAAIAAGLRADDAGNLYHVNGGRVPKCNTHPNGYRQFHLSVNGIWRNVKLSRFVCIAAHGPPPFPRAVVDHINWIKDDDRPANLRWITNAENLQHMSPEALESFQRRGLQAPKGERNHAAKLTSTSVKLIRKLCGDGVSECKVAARFSVSPKLIHNIKHRKSWRHVP